MKKKLFFLHENHIEMNSIGRSVWCCLNCCTDKIELNTQILFRYATNDKKNSTLDV